ncbi:stage III sporulation protein AF [Desulfotomaculum sp. 1211_IL3151]|uniref:stage III sporulation protein AF n=1 Tax=Desulfotomaculum sp. 1211_IL3151 TaxID=3084055 RepID=UPI002FD968B1
MFLESIKELVQVLVILIVMALFLEMLLPNSQMQGYVKMVMGLVVIVVVLEAGANLIHQDFKFDLPALTARTQEPPLESLIHDGQRLAGLQKQEAMKEYQQGIEKQVLALARLQSNVNIAGVKVTTTDDPQDPNYGRLTGVVLEIAKEPADDRQITKIETVDIAVGGLPDNQDTSPINNKEAQQVARNVANFYNIPLEQVRVVERKE